MALRGSTTPSHKHIYATLAFLMFICVGLVWLARSVAAEPDSSEPERIGKQPPDVPLLTPTPGCGLVWREVFSPNGGSYSNFLSSVAVVSANDVWAVGYYDNDDVYDTLTLHWNGSSWSVVSSPNPGSSSNYLNSIAVVSANDIWAVGNYSNGGSTQALILHWNGSNWSIVFSPNPGSSSNVLNSVATVSANDIWAVGYYSTGASTQALILHWDGSNWNLVASPNPGPSSNYLNSIAVVSANDIWAVGYYSDGASVQTLTLHWNGSIWSVVSSPSPGSSTNILNSIAVVSANDIWAVGYYSYSGNPFQTLVMHWNGSIWSIISSPNTVGSNILQSVAVVSANDVWAVGCCGATKSQALILHWDGSIWSGVSSPNAGSSTNYLNSVAVVSANDVWAVGFYHNGTFQTITARYSNPCVTPTNTPIVATATPTNVTCVLKFADVPPSNTFYPYVTCLACRNIDRGFPCGDPFEPCDPNNSPYFGVNTLIARDDLAHMVAASAGFNEDPGPRRFQDVPPSSSYYNWVQRMANRGLIGGYPCGTTPSEPCVGPDNLAYYRPTANATRGQIAKIVSNGAGYTNTPIGQTFEDVPPSHAFYTWVQRLTSQPVPAMGGYPCGGIGEPCGVGNRPYFRWGNNATRGQTSKIVANTFYPNCRVTIITPTPGPTFTPAPTPTPTPCAQVANYTVTSSTGATLVPGTADIGNHCDDCLTVINLPFTFKLYGRSFSTARISSNGNLQFVSDVSDDTYNEFCIPYQPFNYAIMSHWDDLLTNGSGRGIFTSISGSAPNRIFNIEWRTIYLNGGGSANFEVRLYENSPSGQFDIIYKTVTQRGNSATIGVQKDTGSKYTLYACNQPNTLSAGLKLTFKQSACGLAP